MQTDANHRADRHLFPAHGHPATHPNFHPGRRKRVRTR